MYKIKEPVQATKFRQNLSDYFIISKDKPVLVNSSRWWNRIFLDLKKYNQLIEDSENYQDSVTLTNLVKESSWEYISLDEL